jgi:hypothetical protein
MEYDPDDPPPAADYWGFLNRWAEEALRYSRGRRFRLVTRRGGIVPFTAIGARRRLPFLALFFRFLDRMTVL